MIYALILTVILAYLLGSINFAVIFSKAFGKKDIRESGSGNAGTTNVMRVNGIVPGILTFVCDALKGYIACEIGKIVFGHYYTEGANYWLISAYAGAYICAVACMVGHIFPVFFGFKGGKGVATSVGIFSVCCPIAIIIGLALFAVLTIISRYVSLSSLIATVVVVTLATVFRNDQTPVITQVVCCFLMAALIYYKHLGNIKRLISGTENRIGGKR